MLSVIVFGKKPSVPVICGQSGIKAQKGEGITLAFVCDDYYRFSIALRAKYIAAAVASSRMR